MRTHHVFRGEHIAIPPYALVCELRDRIAPLACMATNFTSLTERDLGYLCRALEQHAKDIAALQNGVHDYCRSIANYLDLEIEAMEEGKVDLAYLRLLRDDIDPDNAFNFEEGKRPLYLYPLEGAAAT